MLLKTDRVVNYLAILVFIDVLPNVLAVPSFPLISSQVTRVQINRLHPQDFLLWAVVERTVWRLAAAAHRRLDAVLPTPRAETVRAYGFCHLHTGGPRWINISLRTWYRGRWSAREPAYLYLQVICHEVAHLGVSNHSAAWFREFCRLLNIAAKLDLILDIQKELN